MREFEPWSAQSVLTQGLAVDADTKHRAIQQSAARAQVASEKILVSQNELLEYLVNHARQQDFAMQERDKAETERYRVNTKISKIAAWAGVISTIVGTISAVLASMGIWGK